MEEHGCVAVGVQYEVAVVYAARFAVFSRPCYNPLEERQSVLFEPFGMPLHAHDCLVLCAFDGFYHAVRRERRGAEVLAGFVHHLMVEGVDGYLLLIIYSMYRGV